nr:MAG TPA: hypothetical protein [Caudoviricetes sp.]
MTIFKLPTPKPKDPQVQRLKRMLLNDIRLKPNLNRESKNERTGN